MQRENGYSVVSARLQSIVKMETTISFVYYFLSGDYVRSVFVGCTIHFCHVVECIQNYICKCLVMSKVGTNAFNFVAHHNIVTAHFAHVQVVRRNLKC